MPINFPINSLLANVHKSCSHAMHFSIRTGISVIPKRACAANGRPKAVPSPRLISVIPKRARAANGRPKAVPSPRPEAWLKFWVVSKLLRRRAMPI